MIEEIVELRRRGFRFIALADDNFYPVTHTDIALAKRQNNEARVDQTRKPCARSAFEPTSGCCRT